MLIALAMMLAAQTFQEPTPKPSVIEAPQWVRRPSAENFKKAFPFRAARKEQSGRAVIRCKVTAEGRMADCTVLQETPTSFDFGEAALKLSKYFQMTPTTPSGASVDGAVVMIPITFVY